MKRQGHKAAHLFFTMIASCALLCAPDNSKANNLAQTHPATGAKLGNGQNEAQTYDDVKKQLADARAKDNKHPAR